MCLDAVPTDSLTDSTNVPSVKNALSSPSMDEDWAPIAALGSVDRPMSSRVVQGSGRQGQGSPRSIARSNEEVFRGCLAGSTNFSSRAAKHHAGFEREQSGWLDPREKLRLLRAEFGARKAVQQAIQQVAVDPISLPTVNLAEPPIWAAEVKQNGSFFCHLFKDESQWVVYQRQDGAYALRPWPDAKDGWDEALPPSLGQVRPELGYYRIADYLSFSMAVRKFSAGIRNTSNPAEIQYQFELLSEETGATQR